MEVMQLLEHIQSENDITCREYDVLQATFLLQQITAKNPGISPSVVRELMLQEESTPKEIMHTALTIVQAAEELTKMGYPPEQIDLRSIIKSAQQLNEGEKNLRLEGIIKAVKRRFSRVIYKRRGPTTSELKRVVEKIPLIMLHVQSDGTFSSMNPQIFNMLGYDEDETPERITDLVKHDERQKLKETISALSQNEGYSEIAYEYNALTKEGNEIPVWIVFGKMGNGNGESSIVAVIMDISERKEIERKAIDNAAIHYVGLLARGIAHDLNNVLAVIMGYAACMETEANVLTPSAIREGCKLMQGAAVKGRNLSAEIMRAGREEKQQKPKPCHVNEIVHSTYTLNRISVHPEKLIQELTDDSLYIEIQLQQVERLLQNLVKNAADALPENVGEVKIRTYKIEIPEDSIDHVCEITGQNITGSRIVLEVADNGYGIMDSVRKKMFQPFFSTKARGKGTGLGLAACQTFVLNNNANLELETMIGRGTTFKVYFREYERKTPQVPL